METLLRKYYFSLARAGLVTAIVAITVLALLPIEETPLPGISDKAQHAFAFLVLAFLVDACQPETGFNLLKGLGLTGYGLMIEILQWFSGYRFFSLLDLLADCFGIALYLIAIPLLRNIPLIKWRWSLTAQEQPR